MSRRAIKNREELKQTLAKGFPSEIFDRVRTDLLLPVTSDHSVKPPYQRGHCATMTARTDDVNWKCDFDCYFPVELAVDANDYLLNPLAGVKSPWMANDLGLGDTAEDVTFLFGVAIVKPYDVPLGKQGFSTGVGFYMIDDPQMIYHATHILTLQRKQYTGKQSLAAFWQTMQHGNPYDGITYYCRCSEVVEGKWFLEMNLYPIGFQFTGPNNSGCFEWQGKTYADFAKFREARAVLVREHAKELLRQREEGAMVQAEAKTENDSSDSGCTSGAFEKIPLQTLCEQLNGRLNTLGTQYGLENLGYYSPKQTGAMDERLSLVFPSSMTYQSRGEALRHVTHLEYVVKMYAKYRQDFERLREQVEEIEGVLSTNDIHYAEFEMPQQTQFGPQEKPTRIARFSYAASGVVAAKVWLAAEKAKYDDFLDQLRSAPRDAEVEGSN